MRDLEDRVLTSIIIGQLIVLSFIVSVSLLLWIFG